MRYMSRLIGPIATVCLLIGCVLSPVMPATYRFAREIVSVEPLGQAAAASADAVRVAERNAPLTIVVPPGAEPVVRLAAADLQRYLGLILGRQPGLLTPGESKGERLILLGDDKGNRLIANLPVPAEWENLGPDAYAIAAFDDSEAAKVGARSALVIYGTSSKGIANGVYGFLERAAGAWFFPPRIHINYFDLPVSYAHVPDTKRFVVETRLDACSSISWPRQPSVWKPIARDLGLLIHVNQWHKAVVDWAFRNKLNVITIAPTIDREEETLLAPEALERFCDVTRYAHERRIRVCLLDMTFIVPEEAKKQHPEIIKNGAYCVSEPATLRASTEFFARIASELELDGMLWHPGSEIIRRCHCEKCEGRPPVVWETTYIASYHDAIRRVKPDMMVGLVCGWVYVNPPDLLRKNLPEDVIAYIVPSTSWTRRYIEQYHRLFRCWYWTYPFYSGMGIFPNDSVERLIGYNREAARRGALGVVPEAYTFRNKEMNLMAVLRSYFEPELSPEAFKATFNRAYYGGDERVLKAVASYWAAKGSGDWRRLRAAVVRLLDARRNVSDPTVRDRLKDLCISSIKELAQAALGAELQEAARVGDVQQAISAANEFDRRINRLWDRAQRDLGERYLGETADEDLFYNVLLQERRNWDEGQRQRLGGLIQRAARRPENLRLANAMTLPVSFDFDDGNTDGWVEDITGRWRVEDGMYIEDSDQEGVTHWSFTGPPDIADCALEADVSAADNWGSIFLAVRWNGPGSCYALEYRSDPGGSHLALVRLLGGRREAIAQKGVTLDPSVRPIRLRLEVNGDRLRAFADGEEVLQAVDNALKAGRVALGEEHRAARFDNVKIEPL